MREKSPQHIREILQINIQNYLLAKRASQFKKKKKQQKERKRKEIKKKKNPQTLAKTPVASGKELEQLIIWAFSCFAGLLVFGFIREQFGILRRPSLLQR